MKRVVSLAALSVALMCGAAQAQMSDGVVKIGILAEETGNAITLLGQNGEKNVLLRSQLESLTSNGKLE